MTWIDRLSEQDRSRLRAQDHPEWISPMLATLTRRHSSHPDWLYERKLDGQRVLAFRSSTRLRLLSRNRKPNTERYPEIVDALMQVEITDFVVDGEVVAFEGGVSSFSKLQPRMQINDPDRARASNVPVYYYVFDILHLDGYDVTRLALRTRKTILKKVLRFADPLRFTPHRNRDGQAFLNEACRKRWEGLIAKRADAPYTRRRSRDWLKFKCTNRQEFVIGGYTDPQGARVGFGALLVGVYDGGRLRYAGKVGTGFDNEMLRRLHERLAGFEQAESPFSDEKIAERGVHWVTPALVAEVGFTEWTSDGRLRHPTFLGLRPDKEAADVVREEPPAVST